MGRQRANGRLAVLTSPTKLLPNFDVARTCSIETIETLEQVNERKAESPMTWRIFWAIVLIGLGTLFLLINLGILPGNSWNYIFPALLILGGVGLLIGWRGSRDDSPPVSASEPVSDASRAEITFKHGAGRLTVNGDGNASDIFTGTFAGGVAKKNSRVGDTAIIELRTPGMDGGDFPFPRRLDWEVSLNPTLPLSLNYEGGAAENRVDLSGVNVKNLRVSTGASSTDIILPVPQGTLNVAVNSGAASVKLRLPPNVPASIRGKMDLGSLNIDETRFPLRGANLHQSPDFLEAVNRIEMSVEGGVGSVEIR